MSPWPNCAVSPPPLLAAVVAVVVLVPLSLPQAARNAARAAEPPVSAMNLRRETGSWATRAMALRGAAVGASGFSRSLLWGISSLLAGLRFSGFPYAPGGPAGSHLGRMKMKSVGR